MYKEILRSIDHVAIWPIISFIIFFLFFLMLLWWTFTTDNKFIQTMSRKPLHDGADDETTVEPLNTR